MYSSWLSWLSRGGAYPVPVPDPLRGQLPLSMSPPDVVVVVAVAEPHAGCTPHQYIAHRTVLAANSGYFKMALGHDATPPPCVTVNGVKPEVFAPLLSYMYTGYLDIGSDNIYDMSVATTILHMPRAVELCRNFLCGLDGSQGARTTLVKPIPGLPWRPALGPAPGPPQPPAQHMILPTAEHSPFRAPFLASSPTAASPPTRSVSPSPVCTSSSHAAATPQPDSHQDDKDTQPSQSTTSRSGRLSSPKPIISEANNPEPTAAATATTTTTSTTASKQRQSPAPSSSSSGPAPARGTSTCTAPSKVVIDVACCDGPVRFLRVLNERYGAEDVVDSAAAAAAATTTTTTTTSEQPADENQLHQRMDVPGAAQLRRARVAKLSDGQGGGGTGGGAATGDEYRCLYCNHTFKSHYCYQKHARRHLNPLTPKFGNPEGAAPASATSSSPSSSSSSSSRAAPRAPARPLDMNVQYYPCKTCGSKFPSYYFVHKHRKMCHSGEETEATAAKTD